MEQHQIEQKQINDQNTAYPNGNVRLESSQDTSVAEFSYAPPKPVSLFGKFNDFSSRIKWFTETFLSRLSNPVDTIYQVGIQRFREGEISDAAMRFRFTVKFRPLNVDAWYLLGTCDMLLGRNAEAVKAFRHVLMLNPQHEEARFLLTTLAPHQVPQDQQPRISPLRLVVEHYDAVADGFDEEQLNMLGYRGHEETYQSVMQYVPKEKIDDKQLVLLDLGCGTGLTGALFHDVTERIEGVDISGGMLAYAESLRDEQNRRIYARLHLKDLRLFLLEQNPAGFDIITAANVFHSVGGLTPVFDGIRHCLKPGGLLSFSVEPYQGNDFGLIPGVGRFGHSETYIREQAQRVGLEVLEKTSFELYTREEGIQYVMRKLDSPFTPNASPLPGDTAL
jgi:predicted TPR repeat methyltransferase